MSEREFKVGDFVQVKGEINRGRITEDRGADRERGICQFKIELVDADTGESLEIVADARELYGALPAFTAVTNRQHVTVSGAPDISVTLNYDVTGRPTGAIIGADPSENRAGDGVGVHLELSPMAAARLARQLINTVGDVAGGTNYTDAVIGKFADAARHDARRAFARASTAVDRNDFDRARDEAVTALADLAKVETMTERLRDRRHEIESRHVAEGAGRMVAWGLTNNVCPFPNALNDGFRPGNIARR